MYLCTPLRIKTSVFSAKRIANWGTNWGYLKGVKSKYRVKSYLQQKKEFFDLLGNKETTFF